MHKSLQTLLFIGISFVLTSCNVKAQEIVTRKSAGDSKAGRLYKRGVQYQMNREYEKAVEDYQKVVKLEPKFIDAHIKLGDYYSEVKDYSKAIEFYNNAVALDKNYKDRVYFDIAEANLNFKKFDESIKYFELFLSQNSKNEKLNKKAKRYVELAKFRSYHNNRTVPFDPKPLGDGVNTVHLEYLPSLTADEETLVITRRENNQEDFYVSVKENGVWGKAFPLTSINRPTHNEGAQCLSQDGKMLFFTLCDGADVLGTCDIYFAEVINGVWTKAKNIGEPINGLDWDTQPSISADKKDLYFASKRKGGEGGSDLYMSTRNEDGSWGKAINLGANINSNLDDQAPFIHPDNQTLYFMSAGHPGFGKTDLFYSRRQKDGSWGKAENLGYPINTSSHEGSLVVSSNGKTAYFATDRFNKDKNNNKIDIYSFDLYTEARPQPVTYVKAKIIDAKTKEPLGANLDITDLMGQQSYYKEKVDDQGIFLIPLPIGKQYALNVNKEGYLFHSENFALETTSTSIDPFLMIIELQKIPPKEVIASTPKEEVVSAPIVLKNVFFETASAELKPISKIELDRLYSLLTDQPNLKIQLNGHTDNVGKDEDNLTLSKARAKSVFDYLVGKGISASRMRSKGFGETVPIASNDTEEGRQQNRRTEFQLIN